MKVQTTLVPGVAWPAYQAPVTAPKVAVKRAAAAKPQIPLSRRIERALLANVSMTALSLKRLLKSPQSSFSVCTRRMLNRGELICTHADSVRTYTLSGKPCTHTLPGGVARLTPRQVRAIAVCREKGMTWVAISARYECAIETAQRAVALLQTNRIKDES